ncbi:MAG TPA: hypothetical protein GXX37_12355 [Clostridiaceae bacterium]|nr:hypothetical protein [Clostridiaceae bacterium]
MPIMEIRKKLWYDHNSLKAEKPVIVMETSGFQDEIMPESKCESPAAKEIERNLLIPIINYELINDDKIISPYYSVFWNIEVKEFGLDIKVLHAKDRNGKELGYKIEYPISDIKNDFGILRQSVYSVNRTYTMEWKAFVEDVLGDIIPVKIKNQSLTWYCSISAKVVRLMGLETMMYSMIDYPEEMYNLLSFIKNDILAFLNWQEKEGLLVLNNENDYVGGGSYGFTTELPADDYRQGEPVRCKDLWLHMNSQETLGISPEMYGEFIFPHYCDIAKNFGLVYYGCCEPVHSIWEDYISKLPGIRKVSVSPWCDEEYMGNVLKNSNVIYSRKPSPNYIGVEKNFDEEAFRQHIAKTLKAAKDCKLEFIFRDIYTLSGDISKPGRAVKIVREMIDKMW